MLDKKLAEIDKAIDHVIHEGPDPKEWMLQTEQVIDAYKGEVETMRKNMRHFMQQFKKMARRVDTLEAEVKNLTPDETPE